MNNIQAFNEAFNSKQKTKNYWKDLSVNETLIAIQNVPGIIEPTDIDYLKDKSYKIAAIFEDGRVMIIGEYNYIWTFWLNPYKVESWKFVGTWFRRQKC